MAVICEYCLGGGQQPHNCCNCIVSKLQFTKDRVTAWLYGSKASIVLVACNKAGYRLIGSITFRRGILQSCIQCVFSKSFYPDCYSYSLMLIYEVNRSLNAKQFRIGKFAFLSPTYLNIYSKIHLSSLQIRLINRISTPFLNKKPLLTPNSKSLLVTVYNARYVCFWLNKSN